MEPKADAACGAYFGVFPLEEDVAEAERRWLGVGGCKVGVLVLCVGQAEEVDVRGK